MKVSTEIDNNFGYAKITQLVDNIPLNLRDIYNTITGSFSRYLTLDIWLPTLQLFVKRNEIRGKNTS